jgi:hypothetical protein
MGIHVVSRVMRAMMLSIDHLDIVGQVYECGGWMRDVRGECHSDGLVSYVASCSAINFKFVA